MTDVRLTIVAEDGQVYPVLGNTKGELKLEEPTLASDDYVAKTGDNMTGSLTLGTDKITLDASDGSASFAGEVVSGAAKLVPSGAVVCTRSDFGFDVTTGLNFGDSGKIYSIASYDKDDINNKRFSVETNGAAFFKGDVVVSSRNKQWMLVEQGGLCHMVEQLRATNADAAKYPPLRDVFSELNAIEAALGEVMEKLRMKPPAGWEVWDGSSEIPEKRCD